MFSTEKYKQRSHLTLISLWILAERSPGNKIRWLSKKIDFYKCRPSYARLSLSVVSSIVKLSRQVFE